MKCSVPFVSASFTALVILFCGISLVYSFSSTLTLHDYTAQFDSMLEPFIPPNTTLFCDDPIRHANCTLLPHFISSSSNMESFLLLGNLFSCFWTTQFIGGIAIMTIAGTIGKWYFKQDDERVVLILS